jgi:hypothetical protein
VEWLHLQAGSARLLPRLIAGRPRGAGPIRPVLALSHARNVAQPVRLACSGA